MKKFTIEYLKNGSLIKRISFNTKSEEIAYFNCYLSVALSAGWDINTTTNF